jgi:hypothetical protein
MVVLEKDQTWVMQVVIQHFPCIFFNLACIKC